MMTESALAEQRLTKVERQLRLTMQLSQSSFWEFVLTDGLVENSYLDEGAVYWEDDRGAPAGSDFGSSLTALGVLPEDRLSLTRAIQACVDGKTPEFHFDVRWRQPDGAIRWRQARGIVSRDPDGTARGFTGIGIDITELKRAEEEARRSSQRLELAVLGSNACTWDYEMADGTIANSHATYTNVWELLGYESAGDARGFPQHVEKLVPEEDRQAFMSLAQSFLDGEARAWNHEVRVRHQDGSERWHLARGVAERDAAGRATRFTGTSVDITDRKLMEKALRESEERLRAMFDNAGVSMIVTDLEGRLLEYNDRFCEFLGYFRAELHGSLRELLLPEDVDLDIEQQRLVASGRVARFSRDTRYVKKDGSVAWGNVSTAVIERDSAGKPARIMRVIQDITKRKSLEDSLKESEYRWRSIAETLPLLVFTAAADGTVEYLGTQACEYTGRAEQEMFGTGWAASIHPDDLERTGKSWFEAIEKQRIHEVQHRILRADGEYRWFTTRAAPARDSSGRVFKWVATCTDITGLKQLEQALQRTKERLELAVFSSNLSLFEFELPDGRLQNSKHTLINFWEQLGYDPGTVPQSFAEAAHFVLTAPDLVRVPTAMQAYLDGEVPRFELEHQVRHQDGSLQWRLARGMAVRDEQGVAVRFVGSHVDITDRKRVEERLRDSEERWRTLVETVPHLVFTTRPDGEVDHFSAQTLAFLGRPESALLGSDWLEAIHPDDRQYVLTEWSKSIEQRRMHETHHRVRRADGEYRWMTTRVTPLLDDTGRALKWYGISTDITTIKQLEAELRHAKELLELGVRGSKVSIFDFDMPDGELERARQTMVNLWESLGYDPATAPTQFGPGAELAVHPDDLARFRSEVQAYLDGARQDFEIEFRVRRQDGTALWYLARGVAYRDAVGKPVRFIGSFVDITDKKQAEGRQRESEQGWKNLAESLPLLVWTMKPDGVGDYYSLQAQEFTGLTETEFIEGWLRIIHPDDHAATIEAWGKALAAESLYTVDFRVRRVDGVYRWFTSRAVPLRDETGRVFKWVGTCTDIEERKQLAESLRESERRWKELAEMVPHFVWSAAADGSVDYYSAQATEYSGVPESELHGFSWAQALHPDDRGYTVKAWLEALEQQRPHNVEHRVRGRDGTYQWFSTRAVPILDSAGRTVRWFGTNTNVEGFKRLEAELRHAKDLLELGVRGSKVSIFDFDMPDGVVEGARQTMVNLWESLGYDPATAPTQFGPGSALAIHPDDLGRFRSEVRAYLDGSRQDFEIEFRVRHRDGTVRWHLARGVAHRDAQGKPVRFIGSFVDITDKKQVEERHRESEQRWRTLSESLPLFVWTANTDGLSEYHSLQTQEFTGLTELELIEGWLNAIHPDDHAPTLEAWAKALAAETLYNVDFRVRRVDGVYRWFTSRAVPLRDDTGRVFKWVGTCTDIEERKQLAENLRESERRWQELAEMMPQFVWTASGEGLVNYYSGQATAYTGLPESELHGSRWGQTLHPEDLERSVKTWLEALGQQRSLAVEHRIRRHDGTYQWFLTRAVPILDSAGRTERWIGTNTNVEGLKRLEADLRRAKDLVELGVRGSKVSIFEFEMPEGKITADQTMINFWESLGYDPLSAPHDFPSGVALVVHPDDLERVRAETDLYLSGGRADLEIEYRVLHKNGSLLWHLARGVAFRNSEGLPIRLIGSFVDITDKKQIEERLRASEQRWQHLAEMVPQQVWTATADGAVDYYNARATENTGVPESELHGFGWAQVLHPDDLERTVAAWLKSSAQPVAYEVEHRVRRHDGEYQWFATRAAPILDGAGQIVKWFGTDTNVDSFKRLEAELRHARDLLELGVRGSKVSIFEFDMPDGELENARQTMINLWESLGYDPVTAPAQFGPGSELAIHPDDLAWVRSEVHSYLNGERQDFEIEFRVRHKDGALLWHLARGVAHRNSEGKVRRFIGSFVDITDKKQIEERLRASEQRWRSHAESLPQFVFTTTPDGAADYFSAKTSTYTGIAQSDLLGVAWGAAVHPDDVQRTVETWEENRANRRAHQVEHRLRRADGVYRWFTTRAAAVWDDGEIVAWFGTCTDIENLKQLEAELRHARDLLELGVRGSKVSIFDFDMPDGDILSARTTMINLWESLGYDPAMAPTNFGPGSELAIHPDDLDRVRLEVLSYLNSQRQNFEVEFRVRHKDGTVLWHLARGVAHRDAEGKPRRFIGSFVDITDKKQVEERHRESEQRWRTLAEALPLLVWSANAEGVPDYFSAQTVEYTGVSEVDLCGAGWLNSVHPDDRARGEEVYAKSIATASVYEVDFRIRRADGVYRWFTSRARPVLDRAGQISRWFGTCTDIEDRRRLAEELRASEQLWRSLADTVPQLVFTTTPDGTTNYFSPRTSEYTGRTQSELLGWAWEAAVHPDDLPHTHATWLDNIANRRPHEVEHRIRGADGEYRWFITRAALLLDDDANIVCWFGTCTDVQNLKQLEADLRQAKERLELAIRSANLCIWEHDMPDGTIETSRETLTNVWESFGYDVLDPPPSVASVIHPEDLAELGRRVAACLNGDTPAFEAEHRIRHKDGTYHWMLGRGMALRDSDGRPTRFVGTSVDIDAIKRIEEDLLRAREAAESANRAKDEFLANVSHEIRTPMNAILGMTDLALDSARTEHQRQLLLTVRSAARNLLNIINDLLDFSKIAAGKLALDDLHFSLRVALADVVRALAPRAQRKGLELICDVHANVPDALIGDAGRLRQVLMNLIGNALKFTARGEVVVQVTGLPTMAHVDAVSVRFSVRDTGIGIARDKQVAIFRAFEQEDASTTRKFGGTGLGLTISSQLVALMGGEITVESEPGRGSTFAFTANFVRSSGLESGALSASPELLEGLRVLVIDDNETNRRVLVERLTEWRMHPLAVGNATSAVEALARADERGAPYSLVLLDARMPDIDGISLAAEIQARFGSAAQRLILLSSDDDPVLPARSREAGIQGYLLKPVQQSELLETIWAVMNMPADGLAEARSGTTRGLQPVFGTRTGLRILVAEDNELNVALLRELLSRAGHRAEFAGDGRAALGLLTENSYDLLLLDLHMPEMDGFEVVQAIRELELGTNRHLPIVALTARSSNRDRERCLAAGMDDFLSKPIEADALRAAIERIAVAFLPARPRPSRLLDHGAISRACGGRQGILEKLCAVFQRSLPEHMARVRSALDARDLRDLSEAAHLLYGTVAAFSTIAGELALSLESLAASDDLESCTELVERLESMCLELLEDSRSLVNSP